MVFKKDLIKLKKKQNKIHTSAELLKCTRF